jgi:hypothetical protein
VPLWSPQKYGAALPVRVAPWGLKAPAGVQVIRILTICLGSHYTNRMHPLESILLVLSTALLWAAFTVLMLARLNREGRRALRYARKAGRMKTRPGLPTDVPGGPGRPGRHRLKVWRRHPSTASGGPLHG